MIHIKVPVRVDLAGGTLDCWPLYLLLGDCVTINVAVSIFAEVKITPRLDEQIKVDIPGHHSKVFPDVPALLASRDELLHLLRVQVEFFKPSGGFDVEMKTDSPIGAGLGGSSALCVALIQAMSAWLGQTWSEAELVTLASNLEAKVLGKPTGTQDYFPALRGGFLALHYGARGPHAETLALDGELFAKCGTLVYTGRPHHSGLNNWQVLKSVLDGDETSLQALSELRVIAWEMLDVLKRKEWSKLTALFHREFEARVRLSSEFTSPEIERVRDLALKVGSSAVKICGAGGGGTVLVWSAPQARDEVRRQCESAGFKILKAEVVPPLG